MKDDQLHELLYQALETELGGVEIYTTALRCVQNDELREEWQKYHDQTSRHVEIVEGILRDFQAGPEDRDSGTRCRPAHRHFARCGHGDGARCGLQRRS